jgi:hypothetical protein
LPEHPAPPASSPVARKASGPVEGEFVIPGLSVNHPVGAAGVPAQVQVVAAWAEGAPPKV